MTKFTQKIRKGDWLAFKELPMVIVRVKKVVINPRKVLGFDNHYIFLETFMRLPNGLLKKTNLEKTLDKGFFYRRLELLEYYDKISTNPVKRLKYTIQAGWAKIWLWLRRILR